MILRAAAVTGTALVEVMVLAVRVTLPVMTAGACPGVLVSRSPTPTLLPLRLNVLPARMLTSPSRVAPSNPKLPIVTNDVASPALLRRTLPFAAETDTVPEIFVLSVVSLRLLPIHTELPEVLLVRRTLPPVDETETLTAELPIPSVPRKTLPVSLPLTVPPARTMSPAAVTLIDPLAPPAAGMRALPPFTAGREMPPPDWIVTLPVNAPCSGSRVVLSKGEETLPTPEMP